MVESALCRLVHRDCFSHDKYDYDRDERSCRKENKRELQIYRHCHDNSASDQKRYSRCESYKHIHTRLNRVSVIGKAVHDRGSTDPVDARV